MYDKQIRRRRAVAIALVVGSLILISATFGSSSASGPLAPIQRGLAAVFSPIQEGASKAISPIRDLFGWFGDTWSAKGDLDEARKERDQWQKRAIANEAGARRAKELANLLKLELPPTDIESYAPVSGRVIARSPSPFYSRLTIDKGRNDGVQPDMAVVSADTGRGAGLIGKVVDATGSTAVVALLTSPSFSVAAQSLDGKSAYGDLQPRGSNPQDLVLTHGKLTLRAKEGTKIVTAGTISERRELTSVYPPDIPIGTITRVEDPGSATETAHVRPFVALDEISYVQVLTGSVRAKDRT